MIDVGASEGAANMGDLSLPRAMQQDGLTHVVAVEPAGFYA